MNTVYVNPTIYSSFSEKGIAKSALILGAYSDVGKALAEELVKKGYALQLAGRSPEKLELLANHLNVKYNNPSIQVLHFDALKTETHKSFVSDLNPLPDVAVQVFGLLPDQEVCMQNPSELHAAINSNYTGAATILCLLMEQMSARGSGLICGISSVAGERGRQSNFIYGSAKAGLSAFLSGLRNYGFKRGVHVLTVKPGYIRTAMTEGLSLPAPITATPQEVAKAIMRGIDKKRDVVYTLGIWRLIMAIIRAIPEAIFKRLSL
jgi:decaprenylphospho-beta-D-erythro-pentofuranosid-2-ulose 2-reductase